MLDLNVTYLGRGPSAEAGRGELVAMAIKLGYDGLAWNKEIDGPVTPAEKCSILPVELNEQNDRAQLSCLRLQSSGQPAFLQLTRLTVNMENPKTNYQVGANNPVLQSYDLLALKPSDEKSFAACCSHYECDIICFDLSQRLPFYIKRPPVGQALERGIYFEITYSSALRDVSSRRYLISNTLALLRMTGGKNVILTSAARDAMDLRGPYDVINLGSLFGLNPAQSRAAICENARSVAIHGETRSTFKAVAEVASISSLGSSEQWKVPQTSSSSMTPPAAAAATPMEL